ncbi:hemolysin III [Nematocida homosporus]|uniref:hemolysin III n=1 Tax=Nematocida homosporus TaxID=1912981 RepID=UPI002220EEA5|nr:hemolysin III [Nematocida homosporus]KAI5186973.1 hemolysin III [Nematocida homosporus]
MATTMLFAKNYLGSSIRHMAETIETTEVVRNRADLIGNPKEDELLVSSDECHYSDCRAKPKWRGRIHRLAFYGAIGLYFVLLCALQTNRFYLTIYFLSQIILYGVSSTYHMTDWKTRESEKLCQKLDHTSIFLLISGTQTCVLSAIAELNIKLKTSTSGYVLLTYALAGLGIVKVFVFRTVPRYVNVMYYIVHGSSIVLCVPMTKLWQERVIVGLCAFGGAAYIAGGLVYGSKKPDPSPKVFGYHEVFHVLTVVGNFCFLLTIIWAAYRRDHINQAFKTS